VSFIPGIAFIAESASVAEVDAPFSRQAVTAARRSALRNWRVGVIESVFRVVMVGGLREEEPTYG
jgi:hypothetical protein